MESNRFGDVTGQAVKLTREMIKIPSTAGDGNEIYEMVHDLLLKAGIPEVWKGSRSEYLEYQDFRNVYARIGSGKGPRIMLNCHLDTVNPGEGWLHSPFSAHEEEGRIFGLGAADMKGGSAAAVAAFIEMAGRADDLKGELLLSCVFGEEAPFSLGTDTLLNEIDINGFDLVIVTEPSPLLGIYDYCMTHGKIHKSRFPVVIVGAEGRLLFEIEFFGKASHASHPSQGINALHDAARVITELTRFDLYSDIRMGRGHYVILNVEGGSQCFTVPSYCKLVVNRQLTIGENERSVIREINRIIRSLKLRSKVSIKKRYSPSPNFGYRPYIAESSRFVDMFVDKIPIKPYGNGSRKCRFTTSSVGDFNLFGARAKVPTLIYGPGGGNIHSPNEFVNREEVGKVAEHLVDYLTEAYSIE
jgi:succinyl-diaminopimelate desuccinylase